MKYKLSYEGIPYLIEEKGELMIFSAYYKNREATINLRLKTCSCTLSKLNGNCKHTIIAEMLNKGVDYLSVELEFD